MMHETMSLKKSDIFLLLIMPTHTTKENIRMLYGTEYCISAAAVLTEIWQQSSSQHARRIAFTFNDI